MVKYFLFLTLLFPMMIHGQAKILLDENFENNVNGWDLRLKSKQFKVEMTNGILHLEKLNKNFDERGCLWYSKTVDGFNAAKDFSISMNVKFVSGGDLTEVLDIQWGALSKEKISQKSMLYQLNIFMDGGVRLDFFQNKWDNFSRVDIKQELEGIAFDPKVFNKYEVTQRDGFIVLNINNIEVFKQYILPIQGNSIGFQHCLKGAWDFDEISIKQFPTDEVEVFITTNNTEDSIKTYSINYETSAVVVPPSKGQVASEGLQIFNEDELIIYPNPFTDKFDVSFNLEKDGTVLFYLLNMSGQIMKTEKRILQKGKVSYSMQASVPDGVYILRVIREGSESLYKRIVRVGG